MRIDVLGVGFDNLTMTEAVERGMELVRSPGPHYVVTPNPEIVEVCREDSGARAAVNGADLVLPDGIGVIKAKNGAATGARLLCGLGGSLDVFAGVVERAPKFWTDHGLEWFYRLCKEPRRIGRMMKLPLFLVHVRQEKGKRK